MRLTKHLAEDLALENRAKRMECGGSPPLFFRGDGAKEHWIPKRQQSAALHTLRALWDLFKFHCR